MRHISHAAALTEAWRASSAEFSVVICPFAILAEIVLVPRCRQRERCMPYSQAPPRNLEMRDIDISVFKKAQQVDIGRLRYGRSSR